MLDMFSDDDIMILDIIVSEYEIDNFIGLILNFFNV